MTIPTIASLKTQIKNQIETAFGITIDVPGKTFLALWVTIMAFMLYPVYLIIAAVQGNLWVDTCDYPTLLRFGRNILGRSPYTASFGRYQFSINISGTPTFIIYAGTQLVASDTSSSPGTVFVTQVDIAVLAGVYPAYDAVAICTVAGQQGKLQVGDTLNFAIPIAYVINPVTVNAVVADPDDAEDMEEYRKKVLFKVQSNGGSWNAAKYRQLGFTVFNVRNIYAYKTPSLPNYVDVYVEGGAYGTPTPSPTISAVAAVINPLAPITAWVNYYPCPIPSIDLVVHYGTYPPFTVAQQTAIQTALINFINTVRPFIAAADPIASRNDTISAYRLFPVVEAAIPGVPFDSISFTVGGIPFASWVADFGANPFVTSVTFAA